MRHGGACLAPGVVGELVGFGVLSQVLRGRDARLRNEAAVWLTCIGLVTASAQRSGSRRVPEPLLWAAFAAGLATYLQARQRTCR